MTIVPDPMPEPLPEPDVMKRARHKILRKDIMLLVVAMKKLSDDADAICPHEEIQALHQFATSFHYALWKYADRIDDPLLTHACIEAGKTLRQIGKS